MLGATECLLMGMAVGASYSPVFIEIIRKGLKGGFVPAFLVNAGATLVDAAYVLIIFFGLSQFVSNPAAKLALGLFGMAMLVYLGVQSAREFFMKGNLLQQAISGETENPFITGALINVFNPITIVAWLAFYGVVSSNLGTDASREILLLDIGLAVIGAGISGTALSIAAHAGKGLMTERAMRYVSLAAGIMLIGFGLYFGYSAIFA